MEIIIVIVVAILLLVWRDRRNRVKREAAERKSEILNIAYKAEELFEKIDSLKTASAKANNCGKAVKLLKEIDGFEETREIIKNYDEMIERLTAIQKVLPVINFVEKAYKHRYKNKDKSELNALQDALYEIQNKNITNKDFNVAMVFPEGTGEIVTIDGIESRCKELGWQP